MGRYRRVGRVTEDKLLSESVQVMLTTKQKKSLQEKADRIDRSLSWVIREIIKDCLNTGRCPMDK